MKFLQEYVIIITLIIKICIWAVQGVSGFREKKLVLHTDQDLQATGYKLQATGYRLQTTNTAQKSKK